MYHDKPRRSRLQLAGRTLAALTVLTVLIFSVAALGRQVNKDLQNQAAGALRQAVLDAVVQCYAVEGKYPENLATLEAEYGLQINHERFIVTYDVFASNQLPDVSVLIK